MLVIDRLLQEFELSRGILDTGIFLTRDGKDFNFKGIFWK